MVKGCSLQESNHQLVQRKENCGVDQEDDQNRAQEAQELIAQGQVGGQVAIGAAVSASEEQHQGDETVPDLQQQSAEDTGDATEDIAHICAAATGDGCNHETDGEQQDADEHCVVTVVEDQIFH